VAVAKALAYAWNIPLVSFSSLEAFIPQKEGPFTVLLDAKIAGVYVLQGERDGPSIRYLDPPRTYPLDQLGSLLTEGIIITPYQAQLKAKLDLLYPYLIWSEVDPDPAHVACLVAQRYQEKSIDSLEHLELLYLR
jgi:tRNA A37 threonylcarbamoyladenosine modification protein TsaB